jgi:hypothetical protein
MTSGNLDKSAVQQSTGFRFDLDKVVILALDLAAREQLQERKVE